MFIQTYLVSPVIEAAWEEGDRIVVIQTYLVSPVATARGSETGSFAFLRLRDKLAALPEALRNLG